MTLAGASPLVHRNSAVRDPAHDVAHGPIEAVCVPFLLSLSPRLVRRGSLFLALDERWPTINP